MRQHLLIDELVRLSDLYAAVQDQDPAVTSAFEHQDVLILAAHAREVAHDAEALPPIGVQRLLEPVAQDSRPRRSSLSSSRAGRNVPRISGIASCGSQAPHIKISIAANS